MNTLPALPPVVYLAGRYMTSLDMFMAKVRDVLSSTRRNALMEQEHLLALYRDGVLLDWLRTLSPTDHRAGSMAESLEKSMKMQLTDTDAKKYIAKLFGSEIQPVSSLKFSEYVELLPECRVSMDMRVKFEPHNISKMIDLQDAEDFVSLTLYFRIIKAANDFITVTLGENTVNIDLRTKGKIIAEVFQVILSDVGDFTADLTDGHSIIHTFSFRSSLWVDLGFGVKWATCNIGAIHPWEIGNYFCWGAIEEIRKRGGFFGAYQDIGGNPIRDCATALLGKKWRMPTKNHFKMLLEECDVRMCMIRHNKCYKFISKRNGKFIILPASSRYNGNYCYGFYWSSTPSLTYSGNANYLYIGAEKVSDDMLRSEALTVRPIYVG